MIDIKGKQRRAKCIIEVWGKHKNNEIILNNIITEFFPQMEEYLNLHLERAQYVQGESHPDVAY